jgi:hypothetical protein
MCGKGQILLLGLVLGLPVAGLIVPAQAQSFGSLIINRKKVVLERKLPPTGHIQGTTFNVVVDAKGMQGDLATDLKTTLESLLIRYDSRLRSEEAHPETTISCRITSYSTPQPQMTAQPVVTGNKKNAIQNQAMERVTGLLTVSFQAKDRAGHSLAADNVTAKFDQEYSATGAQTGMLHSMTHTASHLVKGGQSDDTPPTMEELHTRLIQEAAQQIAAHLVNTTEQVDVYLAHGGGLDPAVKLMEQKLWSRALESLETMKPLDSPEEDAYRIYDLGVVNEALAYQAEDIQKARKDLQEASVDYGKAIDAKPAEKYFMQPQNRIDTALAHYKILGDQKSPAAATVTTANAPRPASSAASESTTRSQKAQSSSEAMTNGQVIAMVSAGIDEANVIDTIQHAKAVNFDLTVDGQVDLAKNKVSGRIISAMKARSRAASAHHAANTGKSSS